MIRGRVTAAALIVLWACGADGEAPVTVSEPIVFAPVPGQTRSVAYFTLVNGSPVTITLREVSSPDFGTVAMHATLMDGGVARMLPLDGVTVAAGSEVVFAVGDSHLMLMKPRKMPEPGDVVTLEFHYETARPDETGVLRVTAPVRSRAAE